MQLSHRARSLGGVLFIDLHGYDLNPVQPGQTLDALLRAVGVPAEHIPEGDEQRAGLYRSVLAQIEVPVLVVADNASAEAQVRPLIPGPGPHRVIVTSRHTLAGLGARLLDVAVLDEAAALRLLDKVVRAARPDDDRIGGDPVATGRLAGACGGLPLALQITAALLVADPTLTPAELATEMMDEVGRLAALRYDDGSGVSAPPVAAAFELSYRQLDKDAARMFRLLPGDHGPDVSTRAAAELAGWPVGRVRAVFGRLTRAHLVEPAVGRGRWRMHDLLPLYARQVPDVSPGEREQAVGRLLAWYLGQVEAADKHLRALAGSVVPAEFTGRDDALAWLDAERPNLIAAVTTAAAADRTQQAMMLPLYLSEYLHWRRRFDDWLAILAVSHDSALQLSHKGNEAAALTCIGNALVEVRRFEEAIRAHQGAVAIFRETGDWHGRGHALANLGNVLVEARRFEEAIRVCEGTAAIFRDTGDRHSEGMALINLGLALAGMWRFEEAIRTQQDAAAIYRETGDRHREGNALNNLGNALAIVRRFPEALACYEQDIAIRRETGDRHREGQTLGNLGNAYQGMQQHGRAAGCWREAAAAMRDAGDNKEAERLEQRAANTQPGQRP